MKTTIIVGTYLGAPHYHMRQLVASNPHADIRFAIAPGVGDLGNVKWRNGDRPYREWWKKYGNTVDRESAVILIEQDVLVTKCLDMQTPAGLQGAQIMTDSSWSWWDRHRNKLPGNILPYAIGLVPLAVYFTNWQFMESLANPRFDSLYELDMISELRMPTVAASLGFPVEEINLPGVQWHQVQPDFTQGHVIAQGIYHAVKYPVATPLSNLQT
jgi:hypothetical protein